MGRYAVNRIDIDGVDLPTVVAIAPFRQDSRAQADAGDAGVYGDLARELSSVGVGELARAGHDQARGRVVGLILDFDRRIESAIASHCPGLCGPVNRLATAPSARQFDVMVGHGLGNANDGYQKKKSNKNSVKGCTLHRSSLIYK